MSTCNRLDLEMLGSQLILSQTPFWVLKRINAKTLKFIHMAQQYMRKTIALRTRTFRAISHTSHEL